VAGPAAGHATERIETDNAEVARRRCPAAYMSAPVLVEPLNPGVDADVSLRLVAIAARGSLLFVSLGLAMR